MVDGATNKKGLSLTVDYSDAWLPACQVEGLCSLMALYIESPHHPTHVNMCTVQHTPRPQDCGIDTRGRTDSVLSEAASFLVIVWKSYLLAPMCVRVRVHAPLQIAPVASNRIIDCSKWPTFQGCLSTAKESSLVVKRNKLLMV